MRSHRADHGVARRANAILLLDDGKSCQAIAEFLYLDDDTIRGGIVKLLTTIPIARKA